jgi:hypothetical protein
MSSGEGAGVAEEVQPKLEVARRLATLADIEPDGDGKIDWWKPGWGDVWKHLPWTYGWAAVVLVVLVGAFFALMFIGYVRDLFWSGLDFWRMAGLLIAVLAAGSTVAIKKVLGKRTGPFCIHCGYALDGLPDHYNCPECGRPYSFALIEDYRRDPAWFILRWKKFKSR